MGQSFRFSAVEVTYTSFQQNLCALYSIYLYMHGFNFLQAKREEKIKAAHDEAMFGGSSYPPPAKTGDDEAEEENHVKQKIESAPATGLLSNQVIEMHVKLRFQNAVFELIGLTTKLV